MGSFVLPALPPIVPHPRSRPLQEERCEVPRHSTYRRHGVRRRVGGLRFGPRKNTDMCWRKLLLRAAELLFPLRANFERQKYSSAKLAGGVTASNRTRQKRRHHHCFCYCYFRLWQQLSFAFSAAKVAPARGCMLCLSWVRGAAVLAAVVVI